MRARVTPATVAVFTAAVVSGLGGFLAGRASAPRPDGDPPRHGGQDAHAPAPAALAARASVAPNDVTSDAPPASGHALAQEPAPVTDRPPSTRPDEAGDAVTVELRRLAGADVPPERIRAAEAHARRIRAGASATMERADTMAAELVAGEIQEERAYLADKARGGSLQILAGLQNLRIHPFALLADDRWPAFFARGTPGPRLEGPGVTPREGIPDGATLGFPDGVFAFDSQSLGRAGPFPRDLLLEGRGMDRTLLRLNEIEARGEIMALTFRDMTIDCAGNYFTDIRSKKPITIRLERCRIVGFDMGAGGSVMLSADIAAFSAIDSRIEAGFSRSPGSGNLFRVRSGLLARLDRCTVLGPFRTIFDPDAHATYHFAECAFENASEQLAEQVAAPPAGVRFDRCRVSVIDDERRASLERTTRSFSELNQDWK